MKEKVKKTIGFALIAFCINGAITSGIDAFKHPGLTETELFLRLPHVMLWDFK